VLELSKHCDLVTVEIEHINTAALVQLEEVRDIAVTPLLLHFDTTVTQL
jgi:phosphoribosylaminoimidazole carboxylase (NCAIR synthetase)